MRRNQQSHLVEALEPRRQLTATFFGGVGMAFAPFDFGGLGVDVFSVEGSIDDETGAATGDYYKARSGGREYDQALTYDRVFYLNDGRQERDDARGFNNLYDNDDGEVNGAQFLTSRGFDAGWWLGDIDALAQELELTVELGTDVLDEDIEGTYRFGLIGIDLAAGEFVSGSGRLTIGSGGRVSWSPSAGVAPTDSEIVTVSDLGIGISDEDEWFYLNKDQDVVLFADMDTSDDLMFFGFGIRSDAGITFDDLVGGYNTSWGYVEQDARDLQAPENIFFEQTYLDLEEDGEYKLYDLDDWDSGIRDEPLEEGFWRISNDLLRLELDDSETERQLFVGQGGNVLLGAAILGEFSGSAVMGMATRAFPEDDTGGGGGGGGGDNTDNDAVLSVSGRNGFGREAIYELEQDGTWSQSDLVVLTGGPSITGDVVTWIDSKDRQTYAAAVTSSGLTLYTQNNANEWAFTNLNEDLTGDAITNQLDMMIDPRGLVHLIGLGADGDVIRYFQTGAGDDGNWSWNVQNISEDDLAPNGITTPAFADDLVAFATSWGGLNVVGLDADGTIWSVWWSPGLLDWTASDLTTAYGADPLAGGLTVFLTSWNGINIAGLDDAGNLRVTWWVPSFGGTWAQSNLTDDFNGPTLVADSVSSFVTTWDALNVAAIDATTGEVVTYWWAPALAGTGWRVASLSDVTPAGTPDLTSDLEGLAGADNSLNVFGYDATNDFQRYYWEPGSMWLSQNLTDIAVAL